jgi:methionyl-tRNA formyltransferase
VVAYGQILSKSVLELPRLGCLNLHASILPRHRGASPIQAALLAGDLETGISVMWMDEGLDTGDVLRVEKIDILPHDTAGSLHDRLAAAAPSALKSALDSISRGEAPRTPQDSALATYAPKLTKTAGWIDWTLPACGVVRHVRAMSPWPGAFGRLQERALKIHVARAVDGSGAPGCILQADAEGLVTACGSGALEILELQAEGRRRMTARDFLRGAGITRGAAFDLSFLPAQ